MKLQSTRTRFAVGGIAILAVALLAGTVMKAQSSQSQSEQRWLHVRVDDPSDKEQLVRVNVPLALAEVVVSSVNHDQLQHGHINFGHADLNGVDLRAILDAVRSSADGEFVTVKNKDEDVSVAKQKGYLIIHVTEDNKGTREKQNVEIHVPMTVVDALVASAGHDLHDLNIAAALHALAAHVGDTELVSVKDGKQTVRIWLDSKNESN
jgi:hypothetical protein